MSIEKATYTSQDFWEFVNQPENADRFFERVDGEIIEYMPSNPYCSAIAMKIVIAIGIFLQDKDLGHVTGPDGGYDINEDNTFAPDAAFISKQRQAQLPYRGFNPIPPDLAVEVISPSDLKDPKQRIERKLKIYRAEALPLLWVVYLEPQTVEVYVSGEKVATVGMDGILDGGTVLPGFSLPVRDIFPK